MSEPIAQPPLVEGVLTRISPYSLNDTLRRLQEMIRSRGLTVFAHIDHEANAREAGLTMQPAHVLIFGNARAGTPLMVASPLIALELPLRALVWQGSHGPVWVSYMDPSYLAKRYSIPDELVPNISGVETLITAALDG
ncbi:MAG TPA: DUF302 domain-containing protein [Chloroflexota bacterium]